MGTRLPTLVVVGIVAGCAADRGEDVHPHAVTVIVHDSAHLPVAGAMVYGRGDSGEEWPTHPTDADGRVRMFTAEDGTVTVRDVTGARWHSFVGVGVGDVVRVVMQPGASPETFAIDGPALPTGGGATHGGARCGTTNGGVDLLQLEVDTWCAAEGPTTVVLAKEDEDRWPEYFLVARDVMLETSMTIEGTWGAASDMAMIEMGAAGPGVAWRTVQRTVLEDGYPLFTTAPGWAVTSPMPIPYPAVGDGAAYAVTTSDGREYIEAVVDPRRISIEEAQLPPAIGNVVIESRTVRWSGGGSGDSVSATIRVGATGEAWSWTVTAPAGVQSVRFPDIADRPWPTGPGEPVHSVDVVEIDASLFDSYAEAIAFDDWYGDTLPLPMLAGTTVTRSRATTRP